MATNKPQINISEEMSSDVLQLLDHGDVVESLLLADCIEVDPARRSGIPVLKGTRFKASQLLAQIAAGDSITEVIEDFELPEEIVRKFLQSLSMALDRPFLK